MHCHVYLIHNEIYKGACRMTPRKQVTASPDDDGDILLASLALILAGVRGWEVLSSKIVVSVPGQCRF